MLKKTITYLDFNDNELTEDFYFNISKAEAIEMETSVSGGLSELITKIIASNDGPSIMKHFKELILKSYGEKSDDGKRFIKSPELSKAFEQTGAYDVLFMELITDADAGSAFFNGIMPNDLAEEVQKIVEKNGVELPAAN